VREPLEKRLGRTSGYKIGMLDAAVSTHNSDSIGSAERNSATNQTQKNFATGSFCLRVVHVELGFAGRDNYALSEQFGQRARSTGSGSHDGKFQ
jgi:hypothetical protein